MGPWTLLAGTVGREDEIVLTTIVIPIDGSPLAIGAIAPATALATRLGAGIELVTVTSPGLPVGDDLDVLEKVKAGVSVPCRVDVLQGNDVAAALSEKMAAIGTTGMLCMATHGRTGVVRAMLGSTAESVVRAVRAPVLLIGPRCTVPETWRVVQACIDPNAPESRRAGRVGLDLAADLGGELWLTQVQPARSLQPDADVIDASDLEALAADLRVPGHAVQWEVFHNDDVVEELLRAQRVLGAAVIVTTTHARAGVARTALGSVAMALTHSAPCPVLVVPPTASS